MGQSKIAVQAEEWCWVGLLSCGKGENHRWRQPGVESEPEKDVFLWGLILRRNRQPTPVFLPRIDASIDGGAWRATVHGVKKSWTWLSDFTYFLWFGVKNQNPGLSDFTYFLWFGVKNQNPGGERKALHLWADYEQLSVECQSPSRSMRVFSWKGGLAWGLRAWVGRRISNVWDSMEYQSLY